MVFIINADRSVTSIIEGLNVGDTASDLVIVAPFKGLQLCEVKYITPIGKEGEPQIASLSEGTEYVDGTVYALKMPSAMTANPGLVKIQIALTDAKARTFTSDEVTFPVGGIITLPIDNDPGMDYDAYLRALSVSVANALSKAEELNGRVERIVVNAESAASTATRAATRAAASEESAKASETAAEGAASSAAEDAQTASEAASTASEAAIEAKQSADSAIAAESKISTLQGTVYRNEKRITNIEQGISPSPFVTNTLATSDFPIPSNANKYIKLSMLGGYTSASGVSTLVKAFGLYGPNLFDYENYEQGNRYNASIVSVAEGSVVVRATVGSDTGVGNYISSSLVIGAVERLPEGTVCSLSAKWTASAANGGRLTVRYEDGSTNGTVLATLSTSGGKTTFTLPAAISETAKLCIMFYANTNGTVVAGDTVTYTDVILNVGPPQEDISTKDINSGFTIPDEIIALQGYGQSNPEDASEYNYLDLENRTFVRRGYMNNGVWVSSDETIDVSQYLSVDNLFECIPGGVVYPKEDILGGGLENIPIPMTVTFMEKEA